MSRIDTAATQTKKFDSVSLYRIRKLLSDLSDKRGRGTELVSLYVPPKKALHEVISALREEAGTASNIKSDTTRTHVEDALTKTMQRLRLYKSTPENGLVIFCGAIPGPGGPGNETIELFEVMPNKPVTTYLYRCLAPDTKILLDDGTHKSIGELSHTWKNAIVKTTSMNEKKLASAKIADYIQSRSGDRKVYRLISESGREIVATEDHPFFTPRGWVSLGNLKAGDIVSVFPTGDLDNAKGVSTQPETCGSRVIVDESSIRSMQNPPANVELTLRRLKSRGLLPLRANDPKVPKIARIMGHLFTDGSLTHNFEIRRERPYSHFTIVFCVGTEEEEEEIRADIVSLGAKAGKSYRSTHTLNIDGRECSASTIHIKFRDTAFITLLRALGSPIGSNFQSGTKVPAWILAGGSSVKREFLAALMGGDCEAPCVVKSDSGNEIRLSFHRIEQMRESGFEFARDLAGLFKEFGIAVSAIESVPSYVRKGGAKTVEFEVRFALTDENVLRMCHAIGYRYSKSKATKALLVGEYLRIKNFQRSWAQRNLISGRELYASGMSTLQISRTVGQSKRFTSSRSGGKVSKSIVRSTVVPEYSDWLKQSRASSSELLLWETISSIEPIEQEDVRDLAIASDDHSFFANGFLVHNCDDHFHLDILREMLREENVIGILSLDSTEAGLGIVAGDSWEVADNVTSGVSGKTRKGGQSARRYERLREMELTDYFNRLADHAKKVFLEQYNVKGLIVSGPGPTKDEFLKDRYLDYRLQNMIVGTIDTGYAGREGVRETFGKSENILQNVRVMDERKLVQRFLRELNSDTGLAIYGIPDILAALKRAAVETILVNDDIDTIYFKVTCKRCEAVREKFVPRSQYVAEKQNLLSNPCPNCQGTEFDIIEKDIVDFLADASLESGANVEIISSKTEDGAMLRNFGGISALLRYRV